MNTLKKMRFVPLLLAPLLVVMMTVPAMAAQPTVNLGTTSSFAVLAGTTITNTGATKINGSAGGDVGLYPGSAFTGQADVTLTGGTVHINDTIAIKAMDDLVTAFNDAAGRTPVTRIPTELGGTTLKPGVYDSGSDFHITGTLTLDAQGDPNGVFVFKTNSTLITSSGSRVNLKNSARYCRIFWKVGSSATLGTNSRFVGHIFALTSITANTGATVQGQLMARNGAVVLHSNTITNGFCAALATPAPTPTETSTATLAPTETSTATLAPTATPAATPKPKPTATPTVSGGDIPKTATPWYNVLLVGVALTLVGTIGWRFRKRHE